MPDTLRFADGEELQRRAALLDKTTIETLAPTGRALSPALQTFFKDRGVSTIAELRKHGPFDIPAAISSPADVATLRELEAHGRLSTVSSDLAVNAALVALGYDDALSIAWKPRDEFVKETSAVLTPTRGLALHEVARAETALVMNALAERWVRGSSSAAALADPLAAVWPARCDCQTCRSASGPIAYFTDLLDYTVRHLRQNGQPVTLAFLETRFRQPFSRLPATCDTKPLRQVRICVEVLRAEVAARLPVAISLDVLRIAYFAFLEGIGTNINEIRLSRVARPRDRITLANRLGFSLDRQAVRPDRLDTLFQDPNDRTRLTESWIASIFGLRDTAGDPLSPDVVPALLEWRRERLRELWLRADWPTTIPSDARPIVDPDILGPGDFVDPAPSTGPRTARRPMDFWEDRRSWMAALILRFESTRTDPNGGLNVLLLDRAAPDPLHPQGLPLALGTPGVPAQALIDLRTRGERGEDIAAELAAVELTRAELERLADVATMDAAGQPVLPAEWTSVYDILAQRAKRQQFSAWRAEEQAPSLFTGPDLFRLRDPSIEGTPFDWAGTPFRSDAAVRAAWVETLRNRIEQDTAAVEAVALMIDDVDAQVIGLMRTELGFASVLPALPGPRLWTGLTRRLQIDCEAGLCQMTTRIAQATETLQGVLWGARNGLLDDATLSVAADDFDEEWPWIGSYASWSAAMQVFLYPESTLQPSLRRRATKAFRQLLTTLRGLQPATSGAVEAAVATYGAYSRDVAQLRPAGVIQTQGPIGNWQERRDVLAIAASDVSGRLYASSWRMRPGYGFRGSPDQTYWEALAAEDGPETVTGFVPFAGPAGATNIGVYSRTRATSANELRVHVFDGDAFLQPGAVDDPPLLVCSSGTLGELTPSPAFAAQGGTPWVVRPDDQIVTVDVNQDGRDEILLLGAVVDGGGRRPVGLARAFDGALRLEWAGSIPLAAGWRIPDPSTPVRFASGVLVVNRRAGGAGDVGVLAWVNGAVTLVGAAASIAGPGGTWTVALGEPGDETPFVAANIDGFAVRVVALQHMAPAGARDHQIRTNVIVMDRVGNALSVIAMSELILMGGGIRADHPRAVLSRFGPQGSVQEPREDILVVTTRTDMVAATNPVDNTVEISYPHRYRYQLLRWASAVTPVPDGTRPQGIELFNGATGADPTWSPAADDRFYTLRRGAAFSRDAIIAFSPVRRSVVHLSLTSGGELHLEKIYATSVPGPDPLWEGWTIDPKDFIISARRGSGMDPELLVVSPSTGSLFALSIDARGRLQVDTPAPVTIVPLPGPHLGPGFRVAGTSVVVAADLDNDGLDECVFLSGVAGGPGAVALATRVKTALPIAASPNLYGPIGVAGLSPTATVDRARQQQAYAANSVPGSEQNLVYLDEAWYFVPVAVASSLAGSGEFEAALAWFRRVYDYTRAPADRPVAARLLEATTDSLVRAIDWLDDPLDPHRIAETRGGAYLRFTATALVRCLVDFGDSEFTKATPESVARARTLYLMALALLDDGVDAAPAKGCDALLSTLEVQVGDDAVLWGIQALKAQLGGIADVSTLSSAVGRIRKILASDGAWGERFAKAQEVVRKLTVDDGPATAGEILTRESAALTAAARLAAAHLPVSAALEGLRRVPADGRAREPFDIRIDGVPGDAVEPADGPIFGKRPRYVPAPRFEFCVPANPEIDGLRARALANLKKLRTCRNIAGMSATLGLEQATVRERTGSDGRTRLELRPLPGPLPVAYRYAVLIERAKQLVELARGMEMSLLAALESASRRQYEQLRARQDLELARASVRLKDLHLKLATDGIVAARLQLGRAKVQQHFYSALLSRGQTENETAAVALNMVGTVLGASPSPMGGLAAGAGASAQLFASHASAERSAQEWWQNRDLAEQDVRLGTNQITSANDEAGIAAQELAASATQVGHAEAVLEFLTVKAFGGEALYDWMSGVLQQIYRFFLQQAAAVARLAEAQLAFERQQVLPVLIQPDYWMPQDASLLAGDGQTTPDTHGLTGSARLQQDIYRLDQLAFLTNTRKLQLTETISLAEADPVAFQLFRSTGVLPFTTSMQRFDERFPGHYLRLIRRVRTSVIALVPPTEGIRATLSSGGVSRTVVGGDTFKSVVVRRGPEAVALTSAINATGLFELDMQPELLMPFEGAGVEGVWEFRMPRAANRFDYQSIADVLIAIEYTALQSDEYARQVTMRLPAQTSADRAFSFRNDFPDAWYDLHNQEDPTQPLRATFETERIDFPANLDRLHVQHLMLYFAQTPGSDSAVPVAEFSWKSKSGARAASPALGDPVQLTSVDGRLSTRTGGWNFVVAAPPQPSVGGLPVEGTWELILPAAVRNRFARQEIRDILFVMTYAAARSQWP